MQQLAPAHAGSDCAEARVMHTTTLANNLGPLH